MRDLFPGYYRPTSEDFDSYWSSGLLVLDANVLLSLYRFSLPARKQLLEILTAAKPRLWVSHQAALEYERGRIGVIDEQRKLYDQVLEEIEKSKKRVLGSVRRKSVMDNAELAKELDENLRPVIEHVKQLQAEHPDPLPQDDWLATDLVRDALAELLEAQVGAPLQGRDVAKEGSRRYAARIPPGYADEKKPEAERYGDLILWFELLAHAKEGERPIVLVTGDQKEDWWLRYDGQTVGPRPELVKEMRDHAGVPFYMYGLEPFMTEASRRFNIETSEETLQEAKHLGHDPSQIRNWFSTAAGKFTNAAEAAEFWETWNQPVETIRTFPTVEWTGGTADYSVVVPARADAFVMDDEVVLTFTAGHPPPRDNRVVCRVATSSGGLAKSVSGGGRGGTVIVRFPKDFAPALALEDGSYNAVWSDQPMDESLPPTRLAEVSFQVSTS
jgi:PIN like domain